MRPEDTNSCV